MIRLTLSSLEERTTAWVIGMTTSLMSTSLFLCSTLSHPLCSVKCSFVVQNARALASILLTFSEHIFARLRTRVLTEYVHGGATTKNLRVTRDDDDDVLTDVCVCVCVCVCGFIHKPLKRSHNTGPNSAEQQRLLPQALPHPPSTPDCHADDDEVYYHDTCVHAAAPLTLPPSAAA